MVQGSGCRVQGAGIRAPGFMVYDLWCRVQGAGFRVQGAGLTSFFETDVLGWALLFHLTPCIY